MLGARPCPPCERGLKKIAEGGEEKKKIGKAAFLLGEGQRTEKKAYHETYRHSVCEISTRKMPLTKDLGRSRRPGSPQKESAREAVNIFSEKSEDKIWRKK